MAKKAVKKPAPKASAKAAPKAAPKKTPAKSASAPKAAAKPVAKAAAKPAPKAAPVKPAPKAAPAPKEKPTLVAVKSDPAEGKKVISRQSLEAASVEAGKSADIAPAAAAQAASAPVRALKAVKGVRSAKVDKGTGSDDEKRWQDLHEKYSSDKAATYDMKATFEPGKPIQHKILGWGWILSNENDRLEVLFKDGKRILISNYNPNR